MIFRKSLWTITLVSLLSLVICVPPLHAARNYKLDIHKSAYLPIYLLIAYQYQKDGKDKLIMSLVQIPNHSSLRKLSYVNFYMENRELRYWADYLDKKGDELRQYLLILIENQTPRHLENINFSLVSTWNFADWYKLYECLIQKSDPDRHVFQQITLSPPYLFSLKINEMYVKQKMVDNLFDIENSIADIPDGGIDWLIKNLDVLQSTIKDAESVNHLSMRLQNALDSQAPEYLGPNQNQTIENQPDQYTNGEIKNIVSQLKDKTSSPSPIRVDLTPLIESNNQAVEKLSKKMTDDMLTRVPGQMADALLGSEKFKIFAEKAASTHPNEKPKEVWPLFISLLFLLIITFTISMLYLSYIYRSINRKKPVGSGDGDAGRRELKMVEPVKLNHTGLDLFLSRIESRIKGDLSAFNEDSLSPIRQHLQEIREILENASTKTVSDQFLKEFFDHLDLRVDDMKEKVISDHNQVMHCLDDIVNRLDSFPPMADHSDEMSKSLTNLETVINENQTTLTSMIEGLQKPDGDLSSKIQALSADIDHLRKLLPDSEVEESGLIAIDNNEEFLLQLSTLLTKQKETVENLKTEIRSNMEEYLYIGGPDPQKPVIDTFHLVKKIWTLLQDNDNPPKNGNADE